MRSFFTYLKKIDWVLTGAALLLTSFGLLFLYHYGNNQENLANFKKQIFFLIIGFVLMFLISLVDWGFLKDNSYIILISYFICLILLGGLFIFAGKIRGVKSWYKVGLFSLDPIEFTKIVLVFLLAKYFSSRHAEMYKFRHIIISGVYVGLPSLLIFFQPDLGSVLVLLALWIGILVVSGIQLNHFLILVFCGILVFAFAWGNYLKDYQKERIIDFLLPQLSDPLDIGWNQRQSKIAVGSGGLTGKGLGEGSQTQYGYLPEPETDFIFAGLAEETGLFGVLILFSLFLILIWRIIKIAIESRFNFFRFFSVGFAVLILSQLFIHVGMNIGFLPIIGISLPFVSYGGSGLVTYFAGLGILHSIKRNSC
jgi:rod shape determining protein RodA